MAKSQSLAAQAGLTNEVKLPAMFEAPVQVDARSTCPYVTFAHPLSKLWGKIVGKYPDVSDGQPFLVDGDSITKLSPMKYSLMTAKQYWAKGDQEGLTDVSLSERHDFKENVEAVVLLFVDGRVMPASCQFRSVKTGAIHPMVTALEQAQTPAWADLSPAHKETLVCQKPFMRFYGEVTILPARTSKSSGYKYTPATVTVKPTAVAEWRVLAEHFNGESDQSKAFYAKLEEAADVFKRRIDEVVAKAK